MKNVVMFVGFWTLRMIRMYNSFFYYMLNALNMFVCTYICVLHNIPIVSMEFLVKGLPFFM